MHVCSLWACSIRCLVSGVNSVCVCECVCVCVCVCVRVFVFCWFNSYTTLFLFVYPSSYDGSFMELYCPDIYASLVFVFLIYLIIAKNPLYFFFLCYTNLEILFLKNGIFLFSNTSRYFPTNSNSTCNSKDWTSTLSVTPFLSPHVPTELTAIVSYPVIQQTVTPQTQLNSRISFWAPAWL